LFVWPAVITAVEGLANLLGGLIVINEAQKFKDEREQERREQRRNGAGQHSGMPPGLDTVAHLSRVDVDEQQDHFCAGLTALASQVDRVCVHSVAQWVTTIVTVHGSTFLHALQQESTAAGVAFRLVTDESLLPQW
jgi:hypothetical protein